MNLYLAKIATIIVWMLVVINPFVAFPSWLATTLYLVGLFLAVAHTGEYVFYRDVIDKKPEGKIQAFLMTFIFGLLYWKF